MFGFTGIVSTLLAGRARMQKEKAAAKVAYWRTLLRLGPVIDLSPNEFRDVSESKDEAQ